MKLNKIILVVITCLCFASCGTLTKSDPFSVKTELEMNMDDFVFLGESEISCEYDTYLGFIRSLSKVNGKSYKAGDKVKLRLPSNQGMLKLSCKGMRIAAAKLLEDYPEGRFFQVVMEKSETDVLFLGSTTKRTAKVRVYKFK